MDVQSVSLKDCKDHLNLHDFLFNLKEHSFAPQNNFSNPFNNSKKVKSGQGGRSMIEMLGVLAIIGVLSVGGIAGYSKAMTKYRINKTIEQITHIAGNVRSFFAPQRSYEGLNTNNNTGIAIIKKAKLVPDEMWDGNSIKGMFGEYIHLSTAHKSTNTDKQAFRIGYTELPNDEDTCIELLSQDWSSSNVSFIRLGDGGPVGEKYFKLPISVDVAVSACSDMFSKAVGYYTSLFFYFDANINGDAWKNTSWQN